MKKRVLLCCAALMAFACSSAGATDWEFSDRDRDGTYDAESAVYIQLSGDGVFIDGDGAMVEGSTIAIAEEGTYVVSGALDGALHANGDRTIESGVPAPLDGAETEPAAAGEAA